MGRFDWLEFKGEKPKDILLDKEEDFDCRHYLQQAERAYRYGAYETALKKYARALREDPLLWEAWFGQVNCLLEIGELLEARTWSNKALERIPQSPELLSAKALVLARLAEYPDAMTLSDRAIAKKDPSPVVWLQRGLLMLALQPPGNAAYCFLKAEEGAPNDSFLPLRIGLAYVGHGNFPRAKPYLDQAVQRDSSNPLAWYTMGKCFEGLFAETRAAECYEQALTLQPEFREQVVDDLCRVRRRGGLWKRICDVFRKRTR
ncbi:MAG: tetratricopeptide repeat protein [Elusimicrobia bacterium]|nr:tetratricopeptide repeat protein [Elusimicrobiota bacterium]